MPTFFPPQVWDYATDAALDVLRRRRRLLRLPATDDAGLPRLDAHSPEPSPRLVDAATLFAHLRHELVTSLTISTPSRHDRATDCSMLWPLRLEFYWLCRGP